MKLSYILIDMEVTHKTYKQIIDFLVFVILATGIYLAVYSVYTALSSQNQHINLWTRFVLAITSIFFISIATFFVVSVAALIKNRLEKKQ